MLNAAFRNAFGFGDLAEGFAGTNQIEIPVRTTNVAQQGLIDFRRFVADDQSGFNAAFAVGDRPAAMPSGTATTVAIRNPKNTVLIEVQIWW